MGDEQLPPAFTCVICERLIEPDRWRRHEHKPPVCRYCANSDGHQVRVSNMTRGDHRQLQRLTALASALGASIRRRHYGYY